MAEKDRSRGRKEGKEGKKKYEKPVLLALGSLSALSDKVFALTTT